MSGVDKYELLVRKTYREARPEDWRAALATMFYAAYQTGRPTYFPQAWVAEAEGASWRERLDEEIAGLQQDTRIMVCKVEQIGPSLCLILTFGASAGAQPEFVASAPQQLLQAIANVPADGRSYLVETSESVPYAYLHQMVSRHNRNNHRRTAVCVLDEEQTKFEVFEKQPGQTKSKGYRTPQARRARLIEMGGTPNDAVDIFS